MWIAGAYTATWNGNNIGKTRDGFKLREMLKTQPIKTDDFGDVNPDFIQQGVVTEITLDYVNYDLIVQALNAIAYDPTTSDSTKAYGRGQMRANVGCTALGYNNVSGYKAHARPLILTPTTGTPAAATAAHGGANQGVWTFAYALVVNQTENLLSTKLRQGPITFRLYPVPVWDSSNASGVAINKTFIVGTGA